MIHKGLSQGLCRDQLLGNGYAQLLSAALSVYLTATQSQHTQQLSSTDQAAACRASTAQQYPAQPAAHCCHSMAAPQRTRIENVLRRLREQCIQIPHVVQLEDLQGIVR